MANWTEHCKALNLYLTKPIPDNSHDTTQVHEWCLKYVKPGKYQEVLTHIKLWEGLSGN